MHHSNNDHVIILDNFSTSTYNTNLSADEIIPFDLSSIDERGTDTLNSILSEADLVYHMAGSVGVKYVDRDPKGTLRNSFNINSNLFPLFEYYKSRVIFASSSEVYGNTNEAKETDTLKIGSPEILRWGYACGKLMSEFLLRSYNFPSTIVRFFNVSGNGQLSDFGMVLPTFIEKAKAGEDLVVYGTGEQYRTFCDIRDAIRMLDILSQDIHIGEIYNIGNSSNIMTMAQLAEEVISVTGSESSIIYRDYNEDFSSDHGEIFKRRPNTDKIDQYYTAKYSIRDIIRSMI